MSTRVLDTEENRAERENVHRAVQQFVTALGFEPKRVAGVQVTAPYEVTVLEIQQDDNGQLLRDEKGFVLRALVVGSSELIPTMLTVAELRQEANRV